MQGALCGQGQVPIVSLKKKEISNAFYSHSKVDSEEGVLIFGKVLISVPEPVLGTWA